MNRWQALHVGLARCISIRSRVVSMLAVLRFGRLLERRDVGRRRRRRRAEQHFHHPLAAQHRRGAVGERRLHQHAALAEQAAARVVGILTRRNCVAGHVRECRSAAPAARSRTCSRRVNSSSTLRSSRTRLLKNSSVSRRIAAARLSSKFGIEVRIGLDLVEVLQPQPLRRRSASPSASARGSASMRAGLLLEHARASRACRCWPASSSSWSGGAPQRKNDSRDARSRSATRYGLPAWPPPAARARGGR